MENKRKNIDEMLQILSEAPDSQINTMITNRLKTLIGKPFHEIKTEIMHIIDDSVYASLTSGFALKTLHILHEVYLDGKLEDFNDENCPWRKKNEKNYS